MGRVVVVVVVVVVIYGRGDCLKRQVRGRQILVLVAMSVCTLVRERDPVSGVVNTQGPYRDETSGDSTSCVCAWREAVCTRA